MTIGTKIYTILNGSLVGEDEFGNLYYESKKKPKVGKKKRWVMYNGKKEASKVPPNWHGWIHYTFDKPIDKNKSYDWQKTHIPNLTGTDGAYFPPGHEKSGGTRDKAIGDYEAWQPNQD